MGDGEEGAWRSSRAKLNEPYRPNQWTNQNCGQEGAKKIVLHMKTKERMKSKGKP